MVLISVQSLNSLDRGERFCYSIYIFRAISSAGEHCLHTAGVTGSIPVSPTMKHDGPDSKNIRPVSVDCPADISILSSQFQPIVPGNEAEVPQRITVLALFRRHSVDLLDQYSLRRVEPPG